MAIAGKVSKVRRLNTLYFWISKGVLVFEVLVFETPHDFGIKSVDSKHPRLNVNNPSDDIAECEIGNMELEIEESEDEQLRRRIIELELSLERETARRKSVRPSAIFFHKAVIGGSY